MAGKRRPTDEGAATAVPKAGNPIDQHVGARVRMRRLMLGMSQDKLGTALDLTFQQVQKYEKGTNRIGASRLQDIARILGVPPAFFFDGADGNPVGQPVFGVAEQPGASYVTDLLGTTDGLSLNRAFASIADPRVRRRIVDLVTAIAEAQPPDVSPAERSE